MSKWHLLTATVLFGSIAALAPATAQTPSDQQQAEQPQAVQSGDQQARQPQDSGAVEIIALPEWRYDELYTDGVSVEELVGADVQGPTGEDIGDVENVIFGEDGRVLSLIAEVGGFLDIADTHVNIPWDQVEVGLDEDDITIPLTQETIEDYSLFADPLLTTQEAGANIAEVAGEDLGVVLTGPRAWRATEDIGDYARLRDGEAFVNYGYVNDLIIRDGALAAVLVSPDVTWGAPGLYAYPYYGYPYGFTPGSFYYDLPYERDEIAELEPFDSERLDD